MRTKYVKIERGEGFKNTYTTLKAAVDALARGLIQSYTPVTLKQIKEQRLNEYKERAYFRHVQSDDFIKAYDRKRFKARVISGGPRTELLVQILDAPELHLQPLYVCNIQGAKTWYPETACVYYNTGDVIDVELKVFSDFKVFVCGLTPGILDVEHWNRIKDQPLAFRCDESGNAVTGLFK